MVCVKINAKILLLYHQIVKGKCHLPSLGFETFIEVYFEKYNANQTADSIGNNIINVIGSSGKHPRLHQFNEYTIYQTQYKTYFERSGSIGTKSSMFHLANGQQHNKNCVKQHMGKLVESYRMPKRQIRKIITRQTA